MNGFLNTGYTARLWWGRLQIQAWRNGFWLIAWNGLRHYFVVSGQGFGSIEHEYIHTP